MAVFRRKRSDASAVSAILEIRHVTRRFAGLIAVDDVSFTLQSGEILGVIGPNGAGKTTLVSLISGTLAPTSGDIFFEGRSLGRLPAYRRARLGIGRTFQIMRPFPGLSVLDNVAVGALFGRGGGQAQLAKAREQARSQLDFVGLGRNVDQRADELGGPGRKRLELAKALAMQPKVLLCDEVMAGLNLVEIEELIGVIRKVRDAGISVLVIEHVIKAIISLSDRLLVLHHGEKIAQGEPESVLADRAVIEAYLGKRRT
jgi:branched-chain amino acid transport system ATP-binding protein